VNESVWRKINDYLIVTPSNSGGQWPHAGMTGAGIERSEWWDIV